MSQTQGVTLGTAILMAVAAAAHGQPAPGAEFRVNSYTTDSQGYGWVAADARGGFVVIWQSYRQDGDRAGFFARRFDRRGAPRGPEIAVNEVTADNQLAGSVASDARGNFVVAWRRNETSPPPFFRVVARRFDRAGAPLGPEFLVSSAPTTAQHGQGWVAMQPDGRFLVVWVQNAPSVAGRLFDAAGAPVGSDLAISSTIGAEVVEATAAPDGGYLVIWHRFEANPVGYNVYAQRLAASGAPVGSEFRVHSDPAGYDRFASAAFAGNGAFVIAWQKGPTLPDQDIFARRFDAAGAPIGLEFQVSTDPDTQCCPNVQVGRDGGFTVVWTGYDNFLDVYARRYDANGWPLEAPFKLPSLAGGYQLAGSSSLAPGDHLVATWASEFVDGDGDAMVGRLLGVVPMAMAVDAAPMQSNGNGVLEAGETVAVAPSWANADRAPLALTGTMSDFSGPGSATYTLTDAGGAYGTVSLQATASCTSAADCYALSVSVPPSRPSVHWDASVRERVTPRGDMTWPLHVGGSFNDVPAASGFYRFVETLLHHGVTAGCAGDTYCPAAAASREQMAVFVLAAHEGAGYQPRACATPVFPDVPASSPFCRFVEELFRRGVVSGCGAGHYCPGSPVTRQEMAVFVLRTKEPAFLPPACATPMFADVPASNPFCPWIEELARRGVVSGCGGGNYCPAQPVTREQMAVFIAVGFGLSLYGP